MRNPKYMTPDEVDAFREALSGALSGERRPSPDAVRRFVASVDRAAGTGEKWALKYKTEAERRAAHADLKALAKAESIVMVAFNGNILNKPSMVGVRTPDGHQQKLWESLTWDQLRDNIQREEVAAAARRDNAGIYRELLKLHERVPEASNVGEALEALSMTVEEYLAATAEGAAS